MLVALAATPLSIYGQGVDPIVEIPTAKHGSALVEIRTSQTAAGSDEDVTVATEFKSAKNVVEEEKPVFWSWYTDVGYTSEYNFRGTNLTPNSDGAIFRNVRVTKWNFTLGFFGIHQLGDAHVDSWSVGEGGGSAGAAGGDAGVSGGGLVHYGRFPMTTQREFNESDIFLSYKFSVGPVDVTIGDIAFFIERRAETFEVDVLPPGFIWNIPDTDTQFRFVGPNPTVQNEQFDRVYLTLSTTKLSKYITPQLTFYQTVYSEGQEPEAENVIRYAPVFVDGPIGLTPFPHLEPGPGFFRPSNPRPNDERNEALGGYLEGRINGSFPITNWLDFNPYTILSVSFRDRAEPGGTSAETAFGPHFLRNGSGVYGAHPLTGWNHFQAGVELPIHVAHLGGFSSERWAPPDAHVYLVPTGAYSYHISNPTPGTDRNEWWGGAKVEVTF